MKIKYSPSYLDDLRKVYDYISHFLQNPVAAKRIIVSIKNEVKKLKDNPYIGLSLKSLYNTNSPYFRLLIGSYIVIYEVSDDEILVLNIYGARENYITKVDSIY